MELTYELQDLEVAVNYILSNAKSKTLLFYGEMGAGKTTLIKEFVNALGAEDRVSSPTFSLVNHYNTQKGTVYHFDFYRINDETEALDIGLEDYLESDAWNLIEWPQKIENLLDNQHEKILIEVQGDNTRKLKFC